MHTDNSELHKTCKMLCLALALPSSHCSGVIYNKKSFLRVLRRRPPVWVYRIAWIGTYVKQQVVWQQMEGHRREQDALEYLRAAFASD